MNITPETQKLIEIVGPSLRDVLGDEKVEAKLRKSFESDFRPSLEH